MRAIEEKLACAHDEWTAILQTLRQEVERRAARSGPDYQQLVDAVNIVRDHENLIARALLRAVPVKVEVKTTVRSFGHADVEVFVDGERVAEGHIGGEPEDNSYYRDYAWIDGAVAAVARKLGAAVEIVELQGACECE
jgi:hypothetical protein